MNRGWLVLAVVVGLAAIARPAGAKKKMPSVAAGGVRYQVLCERCGKEKDCLSVKAIGKDAPAAKLLLSDETLCRGVGDDLVVEVSARKFKLTPALDGVLIKLETGGEAIGHVYWLVAIVDGKLAPLWTGKYDTQEMVSIDSYTLKTADSDGNGRQEVDFKAPFPVSDNAATSTEISADTWEHQWLEYSDDRKAMVEKTPHEEFAAVLSSNKELKDALRQKIDLLKDPKCRAQEFLVLDSKTLPKLREGFYVVAAVAESRAGAQAALDRIKACRPQISGAIRQVR